MRRAANLDSNHGHIVDALRRAGATVHSLAGLGDGAPDLLVGFRGDTHLFEVKDGGKSPSRRKLRPSQKRWHLAWKGSPVVVVTTPHEALAAIGLLLRMS